MGAAHRGVDTPRWPKTRSTTHAAALRRHRQPRRQTLAGVLPRPVRLLGRARRHARRGRGGVGRGDAPRRRPRSPGRLRPSPRRPPGAAGPPLPPPPPPPPPRPPPARRPPDTHPPAP